MRKNLKWLQELEKQNKIIFLRDGEGREYIYDKDNKSLYRIYRINILGEVFIDLRKVN